MRCKILPFAFFISISRKLSNLTSFISLGGTDYLFPGGTDRIVSVPLLAELEAITQTHKIQKHCVTGESYMACKIEYRLITANAARTPKRHACLPAKK